MDPYIPLRIRELNYKTTRDTSKVDIRLHQTHSVDFWPGASGGRGFNILSYTVNWDSLNNQGYQCKGGMWVRTHTIVASYGNNINI